MRGDSETQGGAVEVEEDMKLAMTAIAAMVLLALGGARGEPLRDPQTPAPDVSAYVWEGGCKTAMRTCTKPGGTRNTRARSTGSAQASGSGSASSVT